MTDQEDVNGTLECPCCGRIAARSWMVDGQPLDCGCVGFVSVDSEHEPCVVVEECDCDDEFVGQCGALFDCFDGVPSCQRGSP